MSDYSTDELAALYVATSLWEQLFDILSSGDLSPHDPKLVISREVGTKPLGWIGYNEDGAMVYQPLGVSDE